MPAVHGGTFPEHKQPGGLLAVRRGPLCRSKWSFAVRQVTCQQLDGWNCAGMACVAESLPGFQIVFVPDFCTRVSLFLIAFPDCTATAAQPARSTMSSAAAPVSRCVVEIVFGVCGVQLNRTDASFRKQCALGNISPVGATACSECPVSLHLHRHSSVMLLTWACCSLILVSLHETSSAD